MNTLFNVIDRLGKMIDDQNYNTTMYGKRSVEAAYSRAQINAALDMLVTSDFIDDYHFEFDDVVIYKLTLKQGSFNIVVGEHGKSNIIRG